VLDVHSGHIAFLNTEQGVKAEADLSASPEVGLEELLRIVSVFCGVSGRSRGIRFMGRRSAVQSRASAAL
jgi:hypothetical protein